MMTTKVLNNVIFSNIYQKNARIYFSFSIIRLSQDALFDAHDRKRLRQVARDGENYQRSTQKLYPITGDS